jgi:ribosome-associated heat shock protein Hsp15
MSAETLRIDRWLWCARFYKTRSVAADEVKAGHVRVNGQRSKPARELKAGDRLSIAKGAMDYEVVVLRLPERRGPAPEARTCYEETPESLERREVRAAELAALPRAPTSGKPDKRTRRLIRSELRGRDPGQS